MFLRRTTILYLLLILGSRVAELRAELGSDGIDEGFTQREEKILKNLKRDRAKNADRKSATQVAPQPVPTPSPSSDPSSTPTPTPQPSPSPTPSPTPQPSPTPSPPPSPEPKTENTNAAIVDSLTKDTVAHSERHFNLSLGTCFIFPSVHFQTRLYRTWSLGVLGSLVSYPTTTDSLAAKGALLTLNYYDVEAFGGTWITLGGGVYRFTLPTTAVSAFHNSPIALGAIGWRWMWESNISFGFAGGISYLFNNPSADSGLSVSATLPVILIDLGLAF